jgi:hypothetical protein
MKRSFGLPCAYGPSTFGDVAPLRSDTRAPRSKINDPFSDREGGSSSCLPRWIAKATPGGTLRTTMRMASSTSTLGMRRRLTWARRRDRRPALAGICYCRMNRRRSSAPLSDARGHRSPCSRRSRCTHLSACIPWTRVRTPDMSAVRLSRWEVSSYGGVDALRACSRLCTSRANAALSSC